uniref:Uncharacterized protein n=1 Tax=Triticum urartu TaxID=4572 RepID=A0A8R7QN59_TRIUA
MGVYHNTVTHSPRAKAAASKVSERPVPVLKVTLPGAVTLSTYTSTTLSHRNSSLVFTPAIFLSFPGSTKAVTSPAYDTVCFTFLNVCSVFFLCTSHMKPAARLYPNSSMSSRGSRPVGRPSSSSTSTHFFLQMAPSPRNTSAPARWVSTAWDAMSGDAIFSATRC